jgi:D-alanyl-lipoteichoic acid acyltransferase DltB (MBOAT superfamily)
MLASVGEARSMIFNSIAFLIFLLVVLPTYYALGHRNQNRLLLAASLFFYGWWDWRIEATDQPRRRLAWLRVSLVVNLGILAVFKYLDFFSDSAQALLRLLGCEATWSLWQFVLPVGISFYTFQSLSYTFDVYRRQLPASRSYGEYLLYVSFFPQLVAGPIERATHLLPQVRETRRITSQGIADGIGLILLGYVKKVVIADRLASVVNPAFAEGGAGLNSPGAWIILYAFAFQIYADFSGYSDIARGLSRLMGFDLMANFKAPYLVRSPAEFWRHWHISLSTWLRDYLYIPLGGNRGGKAGTLRNLLLTMFLGGLWHGAGLAFVAWGIFQGLLLVGHRLLAGEPGSRTSSAGGWLTPLLYFHVTCLGWLLFRAGGVPGLGAQADVIARGVSALFTPAHPHLPTGSAMVLLGGAACLLFQRYHDRLERSGTWSPGRQVLAAAGAIALILALGVFHESQFIYFQF